MLFIKPEDFTAEKLTARNKFIKTRIEECQAKLKEEAFHAFGGYEMEIHLLQGEYQINCEAIQKLKRRDNEIRGLFANLNTSDINATNFLANLTQQVEHFRNGGGGSH